MMQWIKARLPHIQRQNSRNMQVFRVYGIRPLFRLCIFDWTRAAFYAGQPAWVRVRILGCTVFERNHHLSGLPWALSNG